MALEWLKGILGEGYTDDIDAKISQEIGKAFVAKKDFNDKKATADNLQKLLDERDGTIKSLQESSGDVGALQKQLADQAAAHQQQITQMKIEFIERQKLIEAGVRNVDIGMALLAKFNKTNPKLNETEDDVEGLEQAIKGLREAEQTSYEFNVTEGAAPKINGAHPSEPGNTKDPNAPNDFESRLAEAKKSGDLAQISYVKRTAAEKGIILN